MKKGRKPEYLKKTPDAKLKQMPHTKSPKTEAVMDGE